jgi:hypothetical protein
VLWVLLLFVTHTYIRASGSAVALCYKAGGRRADYHEVIGFFNVPNPYSRVTALGFIQPVTEMSTRSLPRGKAHRRVRLTTSPPSESRWSTKCENLNPMGLQFYYRDRKPTITSLNNIELLIFVNKIHCDFREVWTSFLNII